MSRAAISFWLILTRRYCRHFSRRTGPTRLQSRTARRSRSKSSHGPPRPAGTPLRRIRKLLSDHPEWELLVAYVGSEFSQSSRLPAPAVSDVAGRISEVRELARTHPRAAFLVAWGLLEAALNAVMPDADKRPRRPGTVVEALAMDGYISSETEASLRSLVDVRNRVVHGDLNVEPSEMDVAKVLDAVISTLDTH